MSQRNSLEAKRARREAKESRRTPPAYFDVIRWVKDRAHISTGRALKVLDSGAVKAGSHTLKAQRGTQIVGGRIGNVLYSHYPVSILPDVRVETPEILKDQA